MSVYMNSYICLCVIKGVPRNVVKVFAKLVNMNVAFVCCGPGWCQYLIWLVIFGTFEKGFVFNVLKVIIVLYVWLRKSWRGWLGKGYAQSSCEDFSINCGGEEYLVIEKFTVKKKCGVYEIIVCMFLWKKRNDGNYFYHWLIDGLKFIESCSAICLWGRGMFIVGYNPLYCSRFWMPYCLDWKMLLSF